MLQEIVKDQSSPTLRRMVFAVELSTARNEVQLLDLGDINTGDTFTLTFEGQTTAAISYSATPATLASNIQTALVNLVNINVGEATVVQTTGNVYSVTFSGTLASTTFNLITINDPVTFTPGTVTRSVAGGVANSPAVGETFAAAELKLSKNGGTLTNHAGSVTEIGEGLYYYDPTVGEVDTVGPLVLSVRKTGLAFAIFLYQIVPVSTAIGETVIATGTAQSGTATSIRLASDTSGLSNFGVPCRLDIIAGTGANQGGRLGFAFNGDTKDLSVEPPFVITPDNTSVYKTTSIAPPHADLFLTNHTTVGTFGGDIASPADVVDEFMARSTEFAEDMFDLTDGVETALTLREALRLIVAASAGKISGGATTTVTIRNIGDTKNRIVATVDADGNRSAITTDLT